MKDVAVFGIGKLGKTFAVTYSKKGGKVFAIDRRQERVDGIAEDVTYAIRADVTEENVVENLGINNVDAVVVALGNNFEASIIVTTICKSLGIPYIVASAMDKLQADVLMKIGADHVILPESETGKRLANGMASGGHFQDIADLSDEFSIIETKVPKEWIGKSLIELNPRKKFGFNVIAEKVNGVYKNNIDADKPCGDQESIIVIGDNEKLLRVFKEG